MAQRCPPALLSLVNRAADLTKPFNAQDAVLIIKSLNTLRPPTARLKSICEKAAFALASAPKHTVPAEVVVDAVNALTSLQMASSVVVHGVLTRRFLELAPASDEPSRGSERQPHPQTLHRATLSLMKMGRRYAPQHVCDALLRQLHLAIQQRPNDDALSLAYVGLYPYTSLCQQPDMTVANNTGNIRGSLTTLLSCAQNASRSGGSHLERLRGNAAWQAMHLYIARARVEAAVARPPTSPTPQARCPSVDHYAKAWGRVEVDMTDRINLASVPIARYARFVADFAPSLGRFLLPVLLPLQQRAAFSHATRFDIARVAAALGTLLNEGSSAHRRELRAHCLGVLRCVSALLAERHADLWTLAATWHLAAALVAGDEKLPSSVLDELCAATQPLLASSSSAGETATATSQGAWLLLSLARVSRHQKSVSVRTLLSGLVRSLEEHGPDTLRSLTPWSLSQLWCATSFVAATASPSPSPALWQTVASALSSWPPEKMDTASVGMLLDGCARALRRGVDERDEARQAVLSVTRTLLCDEAMPCPLKGFGAHWRPRVKCCLQFLEKNKVDRNTIRKEVLPLLVEDSEAVLDDGLKGSLTPAVALQQLSFYRDHEQVPAAVVRKVCASSLVWAREGVSTRENCTAMLRCAEKCLRYGCTLGFSSADDSGRSGAVAYGKGFCIPVERLLSEGSALSSTDAAHTVRLMTDTLLRTGAIAGVAVDDVVPRLVSRALSGPPEAVTVPGLLFLLHSNRHLSISNRLFTRNQLELLLGNTEGKMAELTSKVATEKETEEEEEGATATGTASVGDRPSAMDELVRLTRALLSSQLLIRLGQQSLQHRETFQRTVRLVTDHVERRSPNDKDLLMRLLVLATH